jgi:hypothetical protein
LTRETEKQVPNKKKNNNNRRQRQPLPSSRSLDELFYRLDSDQTKWMYLGKIKEFFKSVGLDGPIEQQAETFCEIARRNNNKGNGDAGGVEWVKAKIIRFMHDLKNRVVVKEEIKGGHVKNYFYAIRAFCEENELTNGMNWNKISRGLPKARTKGLDRAPTVEELRKLVEYPERRIKPVVYLTCSSGIRLGAWEYLQWQHVKPVTKAEYLDWIKQQQQQNPKNDICSHLQEDYNSDDYGPETIIAAKLTVYAGEPEEYVTFITPEAYHTLQDYMNFRASVGGEKITDESWLIRDLWKTSDMKYGAKFGSGKHPELLEKGGITKMLRRALSEQGLRIPLPGPVRRYEFKTTHGFRKFFDTSARRGGMNPMYVEYLLSHDIGMAEHYWRPTDMEVLHEYLKTIDELTINDNKSTLLQKQLLELREKSKEKESAIEAKIAEEVEKRLQMQKEQEELKARIAAMESQRVVTHPMWKAELERNPWMRYNEDLLKEGLYEWENARNERKQKK